LLAASGDCHTVEDMESCHSTDGDHGANAIPGPIPVDPVTDWATDFDHAHPDYNRHAPQIWEELRSRCPVAHSDRYGGVWLPTRYDDIRAIAYDTTNFSSNGVVVSKNRPDDASRPVGAAPPITSDPPFHALARRLLLPAFAPRAIGRLEPEIRALCRRLLSDLAARPGDVVDAAVDYAQHVPVDVIARMLGFPLSDAELFRTFVHEVLEAVTVSPEDRDAAFDRLGDYITLQIDDHLAHPREDLTSDLLAVRLEGAPLEREHIVGTIVLLLIAGIDATWSAIGSALWHLALHPDDRDRLTADPSLLPLAVEEFLRAYAPVTMARVVARETTIGGCPVTPGDWVLLPFPAANRDPARFEHPDEVRIDRALNPHAAFGLGVHRCLGSNLARLELTVAIEEFLAAYPRFRVADAEEVVWSVGQVRGPRRLPLVIEA